MALLWFWQAHTIPAESEIPPARENKTLTALALSGVLHVKIVQDVYVKNRTLQRRREEKGLSSSRNAHSSFFTVQWQRVWTA